MWFVYSPKTQLSLSSCKNENRHNSLGDSQQLGTTVEIKTVNLLTIGYFLPLPFIHHEQWQPISIRQDYFHNAISMSSLSILKQKSY